ncbi:MFS transporter [Microbacterium fluvii]|uniref:MFS transporter n=1 Tax=Microbacterium fluvii TaxID=415215 RepID=A0ABW2HEU1_9MICO|nr:MFS transporter [Microbacterium fluvii]MCU4672709.1 MFS transporter [Microbacterium fluvii]
MTSIDSHDAPDVDTTPQEWPNPRRGFLFFLGFAAIAAGMAQLVPAVLTLSLKANLLDPENATTILSITVAIAAVFGLVAAPVFGRVSDRITWRTGRRRPLLILGAILFLIGAPLSFAATNTATLTVGGIITVLGFTAVTVACTAILADQYSPDRRGPASALVGLSLPVGAVIGLFLAQLVSGSLLAQFLIPAVIGAVGALLLALRLPDRVITRDEVPALTARDFFGTFWVNPVKHPSFGWAWWSRLLIFFGVAAVQAYQAFYLILGLGFTPAEVSGAVFLSTLVLTAMALVFAPIAGKLSDKLGRRKPFVIVAALIFAIGLVIVTFATDYTTFLIAMAVIGLGQGVYFAVDLALISEILPDKKNIAKDMGIMGLASTLPSSIVPAVAPILLAIGASAEHPQNFPALFLTGAIAGLLGAAFIIPIKKVK